MKIFAKCSIEVKRAVKAVIALSVVLIFLIGRGINHIYDAIFLMVFMYLIIKFFATRD